MAGRAATLPADTAGRLLAATADALRTDLVGRMPAGGLRDYYLWGLDPDQPYHELFLRTIGATQLARLTATLLDGLVDPASWPAFEPYVAAMNVYQVSEVVSDDLGIGVLDLDAPGVDAPQGDLLRAFNAAMLLRLGGTGTPARALLAHLAGTAAEFSMFEHSLAGRTHRVLAAACGADIGYGLWAGLVANVESGAALADAMAGNPLGEELRDGLVNRYRAVSRTLSGRHLPVVELAAVGAQAILVAPTLAYYVGVLSEVDGLAVAEVVRDGSLADALYDAAVLVRLLNDLGPRLLRPDERARRALLTALDRAYRRDPGRYPRVGPLLLAATPPQLGSRLCKDLRYREFNVCLYGLRQAARVPEALATLATNLDYFARLYALHRSRLDGALHRLAARMGDPRAATLVERFVRFHERLYANPYHHTDGDYAN